VVDDTVTRQNDPSALPSVDALFPELYEELRRIARFHRRRGPHATLDTTSLVNEAYLRLRGAGRVDAKDRLHFLALSARAMRFVLIDYARRSSAGKRKPAALVRDVELAADAPADAESILALHDNLERLGALHARMARVVECRFFGGMSEPEIAELLGVSERTVRGEWQRAKLWLARGMAAGEP
jgi:RNA polymerase sigma factor (TIGR02999 family)